jgi:ketol-acid reductoisomerase
MRLVREIGYSGQFGFHSPTSQYGQLSRREAFGEYDVSTKMRELLEDIASGRFADEWDAERDAGYPNLERLREQHAGAAVAAFEAEIRAKIGQGAVATG